MVSLRESVRTINSLSILLEGIEGMTTTVDLRNEDSVCGMVDCVDSGTNIHMSNVTYSDCEGNKTHFDDFFVQGRNVRFVHIPDEIDIRHTIEEKLRNSAIGGDISVRADRFTKQTKRVRARPTEPLPSLKGVLHQRLPKGITRSLVNPESSSQKTDKNLQLDVTATPCTPESCTSNSGIL